MAAALVDHYWEHGYAIVPNALTAEEVERYKTRAREIVLGDHPKESANRIVRDIAFAKGHIPYPDDPEWAIWKILNPDRFDDVMAECLRFPAMLDAAEEIIGDDILAYLLMYIYRPPEVPTSIHPFHQDGVFFRFGPHDQITAAWVALDPITRDNGGLCIIPGSHKMDVLDHVELPGVNRYAIAARGYTDDPAEHPDAICLDVNPGDGILFHPHLLHGTGGNKTGQHRRAITLHMASAKCKSFDESGESLVQEYGFTCVRGRTYDGCLQPLDSPTLELKF